MTQTTGTQRSSEQADAIRPFQKVNVPEAELKGASAVRLLRPLLIEP
jgi:hypothetical protein